MNYKKKCHHHEYQPRYSKEWSTTLRDLTLNPSDIKVHTSTSIILPYLQKEIYVHDICVKCGDIKNAH